MLNDFFDTGAIYAPWPCIINGIKYEGARLSNHQYCENKCVTKDCHEFTGKSGEQVCPLSLTYYQQKLDKDEIIVYGVIGNDRAELPKDRNFKKLSKGRTVKLEDFRAWIKNLQSFNRKVREIENSVLSNVLHPLHDPIRWAGQIHDIAEKMIWSDRKKTLKENIDMASRDVKSLYKAADMLIDNFDTVNIYFNPDAAKFGKKRDIEIYRLLDKLVTIMQMADADKYNRKIRIRGSGYRSYKLYESFKLIPFSLLQNAIKYSLQGDVIVRLDENNNGVKVSIKSTGPLIVDEEKRKIFENGFRGKWASEIKTDGMGVGLYIANLVAIANDVDIQLDSSTIDQTKGNVPLADNIFWFVVRGDE